MSSATVRRPRHRWFAATYDALSKSDEKKIGPIRDAIAGGAAGRVLEIGCGTGLNLQHYDWAKIESLDATEPDVFMLKRAEARAAGLSSDQRDRLRPHEAPAEALPFADESFDAAVATLVFCTVTDLERALAEVRRVLKPRGELRLFEHVRGTGKTATVQRVVQPVYGWVSAGCQLSRDTEGAVLAAGFELDVDTRTDLGPLWPAFAGVARRVS